jgi:hypothetical protein
MIPGLHPGLRSGTRFGVLEQWGDTKMECQQRRRPYSLKLAGHAPRWETAITDESNDDCLKEAFRLNNPSQILVMWLRAAAFAGFLLCVVLSWVSGKILGHSPMILTSTRFFRFPSNSP